MNVFKITNIDQITNKDIIKELDTINDDEVIVIFSDGKFSKISNTLEGLVKDIHTGEPLSMNPINMKWRPIWVGMRLFNADIRTMRRLIMSTDSYITHYIESDIIKN